MGNNNYLTRTVSDVYYKVFSGYRFSEIDIEAMNGYYPEVRENGRALKKNDLIVIRLSDVEDLLEQFTIKRNSILEKHILSFNDNILINGSIEQIDRALVELSLCIDNLVEESLSTKDMFIRTEVNDINLDKIIKKFYRYKFCKHR